jgi:hypothetical protein
MSDGQIAEECNSFEIVRHRAAAREEWSAKMESSKPLDPRVPVELPGYFCDRYAYAVAAGRPSLEMPGFDAVMGPSRFSELVTATWQPCEALGGWVPPTEEVATLGEFYDQLLADWTMFARSNGLPSKLAALQSARGQRWIDIAADSVFFPHAPAIPGANYFDFLSPDDQRRVIQASGPNAPIDFFCFMLQVHEAVHRCQVGEPLFNEIVQAAVWMRFLDECDYWRMQRNTSTGRICVLEFDAVRAHGWIFDAALQAGFDTAVLFKQSQMDKKYGEACAVAAQFDAGELRYRGYLRAIANLLTMAQAR